MKTHLSLWRPDVPSLVSSMLLLIGPGPEEPPRVMHRRTRNKVSIWPQLVILAAIHKVNSAEHAAYWSTSWKLHISNRDSAMALRKVGTLPTDFFDSSGVSFSERGFVDAWATKNGKSWPQLLLLKPCLQGPPAFRARIVSGSCASHSLPS